MLDEYKEYNFLFDWAPLLKIKKNIFKINIYPQKFYKFGDSIRTSMDGESPFRKDVNGTSRVSAVPYRVALWQRQFESPATFSILLINMSSLFLI